jgi:hypothetical protein
MPQRDYDSRLPHPSLSSCEGRQTHALNQPATGAKPANALPLPVLRQAYENLSAVRDCLSESPHQIPHLRARQPGDLFNPKRPPQKAAETLGKQAK